MVAMMGIAQPFFHWTKGLSGHAVTARVTENVIRHPSCAMHKRHDSSLYNTAHWGDFVSDSKVVLFRRRPPSKTELDVYKSMTRLWSSEMRQRIFPDHFRAIGKDADAESRNIKS